jgi:peptidoglycan/xylan/chitin deacetylase (PgdA/CDA1 family)
VALRALGAPATEAGVRGHVGAALGYDFSNVRLHRNSGAARAEGSVAFTEGRDVHLAPGSYRPDLPLGRALLAHELAHVAQQGAAPSLGSGRGLADPTPGLSPAPLGMRQRCACTCQADEEPLDAGAPVAGVPDSAAPAPGSAQTADTGAPPAGVAESPQGDTGTLESPERHAGDTGPTPPADTSDTGGDAGQDAESDTGLAQDLADGSVAGASEPGEPYKVIHVAWTLDDGPTAETPAMRKALGAMPATWYIMRNQLGTGETLAAKLKELKAIQDSGSEIAIHSAHPTQAHVAWFPVQVAGAVPKAYETVQEFIADLTAFRNLLTQNGIAVKFVRFPGGAYTEVFRYLESQGVADETERKVLTKKILRQESVADQAEGVRKVATDYDAIRTALDSLGLKIWDGSTAGPLLSFQSWEAESSGTGLTDNVTEKFKKLVDDFAKAKRERSLLVLAHDTHGKNAAEVQKDIAEMESYAATNGVQIRYHTNSSLFAKVRGVPP